HIVQDDITTLPNVVHSLIRDGRNIVALDFDSVDDRVYWSDTSQDRIWSAHKNGSDRTVVSFNPRSLAVDWIGRNLYWSDYVLETIEVSRLDGSHRTVLVSENVTNPRALFVALLMFWTDWGRNPHIERASMDGKLRTIIISNKLYWPNGLTIDYPNNLLYFADAYLDFIDYCDYDGKNRKQVLVLQHPHAITIFEDFVYWTDRYINRVMRAHKWHGENQTVMLFNLPHIKLYLLSHFGLCDSSVGRNHCFQNPCTHICLLSAIGPRFYSCACPSGWTLAADQVTCTRTEDPFLVVVRDSIIYGISLNPDDRSNDAMVPVAGLQNGYDVDFDDSEQTLYWVEHPVSYSPQIFCTITNMRNGYPSIGLALDWITENLYYTNPSTQSIEVRQFIESYVCFIMLCNYPVGIAVDPARGKLYWTDQGTESGIPAKVASADMDGLNPINLFTNNLDHIEFLTVDIQENKLYWAVTSTGMVGLHTNERMDKSTGADRIVLRDNVSGLRVLKVHYRDCKLNARGEKKNHQTKHYVHLLYQKCTSAGTTNGCTNNITACQHLCLPRPQGLFTCACATGFKLNSDNTTCAPYESYELIIHCNVVIVSNEFIFALSGRNALHVDVHMASGYIYWCDFSSTVTAQNGVRRIKTDGSGLRSVVTSGIGRNGIRGIAVDWAAGNLYFTNAFLMETYVEVLRLNTTFRRVLLKTQTDMPRHIIVDPRNRYLFWADYGQNPKIERALLDGSNRTILVSSGIITPRGLALDQETGYVYWVDDSLDMIARVSPQGGETEVVRYGSRYPTPYGITVFQESIIWVDRNLKKVFRASKEPGSTEQPAVIRDNINMLRDVTIFDQRIQPSAPKDLNNNPCVEANGGCAHFCFALPTTDVGNTSRKCACAFGNLAADNESCVVSKDDYLIYTTESTVRSLRLDPEDHAVPFPVVNVPRTSVALDFDITDRRIYFTQSSGAGASKISYIDLSSPTSRTIIAHVSRPRAIMLDPCRGYMYWTDWGTHAKIERATLGGNFRKEIVNSSLVWPNGLSLDYEEERLYWADASLQKIERASLTGSNREVIVSTAIYPFAMAMFGQFIYWTDWNTRSIYRANKHDGSDQMVMIQNLPSRPMDIHVLASGKQQQCTSPCEQFNGGCSHICTPAECHCPSEGHWYLADNKHSFHTCDPTVFTCGNGRCVPYHYRCDHYDDCDDNSDEPCQQHQFTCQNGRCVSRDFVCDGDNDCGDESDELEHMCRTPAPTCPPGDFKCDNGHCIRLSQVCNRDDDCSDNSDEKGCGKCDEDLLFCVRYTMFPVYSILICYSNLTNDTLQRHTSANLTNGSVQISSASPSRGSAMARMTAATAPMKTLPIVPPGRAIPDSSNAAMDAASPKIGNVTLMMIVGTTPMSLSRSAVSDV
uniref:EGF-like domain-containing protein n=1 Tax=Hippocampus comes TaxID=109280 RepID=A0A3Q2ZKI3_HIPCM